MLAGLEDRTMGALPAHGALLGSQLEDHLWGEMRPVGGGIGSLLQPNQGPRKTTDGASMGRRRRWPRLQSQGWGTPHKTRELSGCTGTEGDSPTGGHLEGPGPHGGPNRALWPADLRGWARGHPDLGPGPLAEKADRAWGAVRPWEGNSA